MIAIIKGTKPHQTPACLLNDECKGSLVAIVDLSDPKFKEKIKSKIYGDKLVREKLIKLYHRKCAYCESFVDVPEIEHYRPKKGCTEDKSHDGYYWLAYEWTNLLPSCHDCNKTGAKGNQFPIEGERSYSPIFSLNKKIDLSSNLLTSDYLTKEKPLILNPEAIGFDPFVYFAFDETGLMLAKPESSSFEHRQAKETIRIVDLNRDSLYLHRKGKIKKIFFEQFDPRLKELLNGEIDVTYFKKVIFRILDEIENHSKPNQKYSFFWSYLYKNFSYYIINHFKGKKQIPFLNLYKEHKNKGLSL